MAQGRGSNSQGFQVLTRHCRYPWGALGEGFAAGEPIPHIAWSLLFECLPHFGRSRRLGFVGTHYRIVVIVFVKDFVFFFLQFSFSFRFSAKVPSQVDRCGSEVRNDDCYSCYGAGQGQMPYTWSGRVSVRTCLALVLRRRTVTVPIASQSLRDCGTAVL